MMGVADARNM